MAYIDLITVRARVALTPEDSAHTTVKFRIDAMIIKNFGDWVVGCFLESFYSFVRRNNKT